VQGPPDSLCSEVLGHRLSERTWANALFEWIFGMRKPGTGPGFIV
jgi:hypothetical protein